MKRGWTLEKTHWDNIDPILLDSNRWKEVPFVNSLVDEIPKKPGIYVLIGSPPISIVTAQHALFSIVHNPLYVGKAEISIRDRFIYHKRRDKNTRMVEARELYGEKATFNFNVIESDLTGQHRKDYYLTLEQKLIDIFKPPANKINAKANRWQDA